MTYDEFITEYLELVREIPDETEESLIITGFLNEQMALSDFRIPLEELMVILKSQKPIIASYLELIGSRDFKKLLRSEMTPAEALERVGRGSNYFDLPPQSDEGQRNL